MARTFRMLIGGKLVPGVSNFPVVNPSFGKVFAAAPACSPTQLDEAVSAAQQAFPTWAATVPETRKQMVLRGAERVKSSLNELADLLVKEQGKPLKNAKGEIMGIVGCMTHFAKVEFEFERVLVDDDKERVVERRVPLGVVAGITPWNFPPLMAAWKMTEALITGNTIILKPSPYTPLTTLLLGEILVDTFPPGVLNIISGGDDLGELLTRHRGIAKISFTGSCPVGKAIHASSSNTLTRLTLELGGNDAAILLDDVDPKVVSKKIFSCAMTNSGQLCVAVKRLYVHESKFDAVVDELTALARSAKVGDGFSDCVEYGPINNKMQFDKIIDLVEDAKQRGAKVHVGGSPGESDGYFYPPTIVTGVAEGSRIVDEEQFGPVLPVMPYRDVSDAVRRANTTKFGLGASVWGSDVARATEVASVLEAGTCWVNNHGTISLNISFGGIKESGLGRQMGEGTLEGYTDARILRVALSKL